MWQMAHSCRVNSWRVTPPALPGDIRAKGKTITAQKSRRIFLILFDLAVSPQLFSLS
jgi:hypothetical protein